MLANCNPIYNIKLESNSRDCYRLFEPAQNLFIIFDVRFDTKTAILKKFSISLFFTTLDFQSCCMNRSLI